MPALLLKYWHFVAIGALAVAIAVTSGYARTMKAQRNIARVELAGTRAAFEAEKAGTAAAVDAARRCNVEATLTAGSYERALRAARAASAKARKAQGTTPADLERRFGRVFGGTK